MNSDLNSDLRAEISALRSQLVTMMLALIVISGTLTAYLYCQASVLGKDYNVSKRLVDNVNQSTPLVVNFINQLAAYSKTHPDIQPLLAKYGVGPNGIPVPAAPAK